MLIIISTIIICLCSVFKGFQMTNEIAVLRVGLGITLEERGDSNWYSVNKYSDIQVVHDSGHRIYYTDNRLSPSTEAVPQNFSICLNIPNLKAFDFFFF
jgi:hypothetical protein